AWDSSVGPRKSSLAAGRPTLLFGAGSSGALVARSIQRGQLSGFRPVGFLDDNPDLVRRLVAGLPVFGGMDALPGVISRTGAEILLITMPSAPGDAVRRVFDAGVANGLEVKTVPSITDVVDGIVRADRIRNVKVEDLIRRPSATRHVPAVAEMLAGKVVLIT